MAGLQNFAILFSLLLPAAHGMYIGGAPMAAQPARFMGPMAAMGGGPAPFMGQPSMLMMRDFDQPDYHPHMFAMGHPGPMGPMHLPGQPIMYGPAQSGFGARNPMVVPTGGRQVHPPPARSQAVPVHHPQPVQSYAAGGAHLSMAQPHAVHHPPTVQSHVGGAHPPMAQPRTGSVPLPPTVQSHAVGAHPSMAQPQAGSVHHLQPVQSQVGGAHPPMAQPLAGSAHPKPAHHGGHTMNHVAQAQPQANHVVAQHHGGAIINPPAAQPIRTAAATGQHGAPSPTTYHHTAAAAQQSPHGAVKAGQSSVVAAQPRLVQPGAQTTGHHNTGHVIHRGPNPAVPRVAHPQPGAVAHPQPGAVAPLRIAARPQPPRMVMPAGVGAHFSRMHGMAMRGGRMIPARPGPFPVDGTYKTAQGTFDRDGSDLSFDPRH